MSIRKGVLEVIVLVRTTKVKAFQEKYLLEIPHEPPFSSPIFKASREIINSCCSNQILRFVLHGTLNTNVSQYNLRIVQFFSLIIGSEF